MTQPHHLGQAEPWAVGALARSHVEALYRFGEYSMFVLLWNSFDHEAGRVARCPACFVAYGKVAEAYGQPSVDRCPSCFGTTFEGGYRAKIVRPALWQDRQTDKPRVARRGEVETDAMSVESTPDFTLHRGDYVLRADGTRHQVSLPNVVELRTGFEATAREADNAVGLNVSQVRLEDSSTVAYTIPPGADDLRTILRAPGRFPADLSAYEDVRGPLVV